MDGRSDDAATPAGGSGGSLLGLEELLLAVGGLGAVIGVAKEGGQHSCRADLVEDDAKGNRRGLDGREIYEVKLAQKDAIEELPVRWRG